MKTQTKKTQTKKTRNPLDLGLMLDLKAIRASEKYHSQFENATSCEAHRYYHNTECPCSQKN